LQNAIERAVILADGSEITHELLVCKPASVNTENAPANLVPETFSWEGSFDEVTARAQLHVERVLLENALKDSRWNKTRAAEKLGITPKTLLAKMRATGLES
jgi:DNA-binding NtrC family response regulator